MAVNANPREILETASEIVNSYMKIYEETSNLKSELNRFGNSIDDEAFSTIKSKVDKTVVKIEDARDVVTTICQKLIRYAEILEEENSNKF